MKTNLDVIDITYEKLVVSSLNSAITGKGYKIKRPVNSDKEDYVINSLPITSEQLQKAVVNVNIFVPDKKVTVDGLENSIPNYGRLRALAAIAVMELIDGINGDYTWDVQQQTVIEDEASKSHYINIRLEFNVANI